jgi:hypothetical protein
MPYRRRTTRRPTTKRTYRKKRTGQVSRPVKKYVAKQLRKNTELKYSYIETDEQYASTLNQSPDNFKKLVSLLGVGTGKSGRIGWDIGVRGLQMQWILNNNNSQVNYVRLLVVRLKQPSNGADTLDDKLLTNVAGSQINLSTGATGLNAMYYPVDKSYCSVIYNRVVKLAGSGDTTGANTKVIRKFIKMRSKISWLGDAYNNLCNGALWFTAIAAEANDDTGTGTNVEISGFAKMWFVDS